MGLYQKLSQAIQLNMVKYNSTKNIICSILGSLFSVQIVLFFLLDPSGVKFSKTASDLD